jgi:hypothetical protein
MKGLDAKLNYKLGLLDWSRKSQTSIPLVLVMKITPGLVGEKAPQVLCALIYGAETKMGFSYPSRSIFHMAK